jgi:hypothetical protein
MKSMFMIWTSLLVAGCATMSPAERADSEYRRESERIEEHERFQLMTRACRQAGGIVRMDRQSSGRMLPTALEMRNATCDRRGRTVQVW